MKTLPVTLLLAAAALLSRVAADEWVSEKHRCALTIPTTESWAGQLLQSLPSGEVILHAVAMESNQGIMVTYVPEMPTTDLRTPEMERRIQELLIFQGWTLESGMEVIWQGRKFLQFIMRRKDAIVGSQLGIARATIRAGDLYVVTAYGKGEANRANDPVFMRVINTFRFVERSQPLPAATGGASFTHYYVGIVGSAAAAAVLVAAFAVMMRRSRRGIVGR